MLCHDESVSLAGRPTCLLRCPSHRAPHHDEDTRWWPPQNEDQNNPSASFHIIQVIAISKDIGSGLDKINKAQYWYRYDKV